MSVPTISFSKEKLVKLGLEHTESIHYQSTPDELVQDTLRLGEGVLSDSGALVIKTGEFTGRSPNDKFTVKDEVTENTVHWNNFNIPIDEKYYHVIYKKMMQYLDNLPEVWVRDCYACADERYRLNIRVISEKPWTNLFAYNMFLRPEEEELDTFKPEWHVICAPGLLLNAEECGTRQHNAAVLAAGQPFANKQRRHYPRYHGIKGVDNGGVSRGRVAQTAKEKIVITHHPK